MLVFGCPPYLLARLVATPDLMSQGRVGCDFVQMCGRRCCMPSRSPKITGLTFSQDPYTRYSYLKAKS